MSITLQIVVWVTLYIFFGVFEFMFPAESRQPWPERARNLLIGFIFLFVGGVATSLLAYGVRGIFPPTPLGADTLGETVLACFAALFLWDLAFYWYHRAEHYFNWAWAIHRLHHSDEYLNATSALRHSWLESPLGALLLSWPVAFILQLNVIEILLFSIVSNIWLLFIHANLYLHLGGITAFIGGPQNHRIHHSIEPRHQNKNFAVFFPIIDYVFGTYYRPVPNEFPATGTLELSTRVPLRKLALFPFNVWATSMWTRTSLCRVGSDMRKRYTQRVHSRE